MDEIDIQKENKETSTMWKAVMNVLFLGLPKVELLVLTRVADAIMDVVYMPVERVYSTRVDCQCVPA